ncbi:MAG: hypothetical protein PHP06_08980 [Clostridia bacterium]|nr:hypothetical protein [Clostridia bacterium]
MDKSGQRTTQSCINQTFIVKSHKCWWREIIVGIFTLIVWFYCVTVIYFFIDSIFSLNHEYPRLFKISFKMTNDDIQRFFSIGGILFVLFYLLLWLWGFYNKKRYGSLTRRKYPQPATKEDLMGLGMIDESVYETLQREKVIILETNPIRDGED